MKRCTACGLELPLTAFAAKQSRCRACKKEYGVQWRRQNANHVQAYGQAYRAEHGSYMPQRYTVVETKLCKECSQSKPAIDFYRSKHQKDGLAPRCKECSKEVARAWREAHPERAKECMQRWIAQNPERKRQARSRRKQAQKAAGPAFTKQEWRALCVSYNGCCLSCGKQEPDIKLTPDHIVPVMKGGANTIDNIQPLCMDCNLKKGSKTIDYRRGYDHAR